MTATYDDKPWLSLYDPNIPAVMEREYDSALDMFRASLRRAPYAPIIRYFDATEARMGFGLDEPTEDPVRALLNIGELIAPMWVNVGAELDFTGPQHADKSWSHVV